MPSKNSGLKNLVLVGGGHAHVHVLKAFGARPEPGVRLTLITRDLHTPYSGMLPGHIAGHYSAEECHIDLPHLAAATGAALVHAQAVGLDLERRLVACRDRPPLPYDTLSLDIGSGQRMNAPGAAQRALPVKPVEDFLAIWRVIVEGVERGGAAPRIVVVGGGAGGVETALAVRARLARALDQTGRGGTRVRILLITRGQLLPRLAARARRLLAAELARQGIEAITHSEVAQVADAYVATQDGRRIPCDHAIWVTGAAAAGWLRETGLSLDERGFVAVNAALRSVSHPDVFAAGDVASVLPHPRPKAGVYAVRQGPPLADNLRRALRGEPVRPFTPQRRALALVGTGTGSAVASWGPLAVRGRLVWRWKEWIDRRWMRQYQDLAPRGPHAVVAQDQA